MVTYGVEGLEKFFFFTKTDCLRISFCFSLFILYLISYDDNLKLKETLKSESFKHFNFSHLANANVSDGGWSSIH